jgi:hypothetical protein
MYDDYKLTCLHFLDFGLDQLDDNNHTTKMPCVMDLVATTR